MSFLLDTHVWLWSLLTPEKLSDSVVDTLGSQSVDLWLSPISTWELVILVEKGRMILEDDVDLWLRSAREIAPFKEAPITHRIARQSRLIDLPHQDPADRFLAATAKVLDLTLITSDTRLLNCEAISVLPAR